MDKRLLILYGVWVFWALYGLIFNISFIDEAKYIQKGSLIVSGEVSYYNTENFFYQHMPGSLLWFGIGQFIFGHSLVVARIQALLTGIFIPLLTYLLIFRITKKTGPSIFGAMLLVLTPVLIFYYSTATPTSLISILFLLSFIFLYNKSFILSSLAFTLLIIVRENFIFTFASYLLYLSWLLRTRLKDLILNYVIVIATLSIFILPSPRGIFNILKYLPGVSIFYPIPSAEKEILSLNWQSSLHGYNASIQALLQFLSIYQLWALSGLAFALLLVLRKQKNILNGKKSFVYFMVIVGFENFFAHAWAAYKLSPRSLIHYFAYFAPIMAVIFSLYAERIKHHFIGNQKPGRFFFFFLIFGFVAFSIPSLRQAAICNLPKLYPDLIAINSSARQLRTLLPEQEPVIWLAEPITLYLAGGTSYYPLANHFNFYKYSSDTKTVQSLGFWNQNMLTSWLETTNNVFVDPNKIKLLEQTPEGRQLVQALNDKLNSGFVIIKKFDDRFWPKGIIWYQKKLTKLSL